jgi:hypothetical protein
MPSGGSQVFFEWGFVIECPPGTMIIADYSNNLHGVTRINARDGVARVSVIMYNNQELLAANEAAANKGHAGRCPGRSAKA